MSDNKINAPQNEQELKNPVSESAFYVTIDNLYKKVISDVYARLQALKIELNNELKYTSAQINAFCEISQRDSAMLAERNQMTLDGISNEMKYGYQQNQMIHEDLVHLVGEDLMAKIDTLDGKLDVLKELEEKIIPAVKEELAKVDAKVDAIEFPVNEIKEKIDEASAKYEAVDYAKIEEIVNAACESVSAKEETCAELVTYEGIEACIDYEKIEKAANDAANGSVDSVLEGTKALLSEQSLDFVDKVTEVVTEKTNETLEKAAEKVTEQTDRVLTAISEIQMPENVDYEYLVERVGEKVLELLRAEKMKEEAEKCAVEEVVEETVEETVEEPVNEAVEETTETVAEEAAEPTVEETVAEVVEETAAAETESVEEATEECVEKCAEEKVEFNYDEIVERVAAKVVETIETIEKIDYKQIEEMVQCVAVDSNVLADTVAERVLEKTPPVEVETIDYDRIGDVVAGKIPLPEGIDYERLAETILAKMPAPVEPEKVDYEALADAVLAKMPAPVEPEKIDYEALSDLIVAKMPKPVEPQPVDYETLAEMVTAKILASEDEKEAPSYEVLLDQEGVDKVACGVFERLDLDAIAEKIAEKMPVAEKEEINYDLLADMVADRLAVKVEILTEPVEEAYEETVEEVVSEEVVEETVEEVVSEEVVEETVEEVVDPVEEVLAADVENVEEEVVEETVAEESTEEVVEETPVEETVDPVVDEVAATTYESEDGELVNAETGLVIRLKRSFSAKLKQSDESVKVYYDQIKNELVSYKKVKSTVSWHGDRFNLGRATIAKMNICGKTLCFYVALDPADPALKETVYHQKNVGDQKAYQATPFKVKVKSEMGAKRAVRLVGILAEKMNADKKADFVPTDYVEEFAYESTQELLQKGLIKETQEKKIDFEF